MNKVLLKFCVGLTALSLTGCSNLSTSGSFSGEVKPTDFPLSIGIMPDGEGRWGTFCESIIGQGWSCIVDVKLKNTTKAPWDGLLSANIVSDTGASSVASNAPDNSQLLGTFSQTANPGEGWEWAIYFSVGENQKFTSVEVRDGADVVAALPVCIGSSEELSQGC